MPNHKDLRKQIRNVLQSEYGAILTGDIAQAIERRVLAVVTEKLEKVAKNVEETLQSINERSKDTMGMLVRQVSAPVQHSVPAETTVAVPVPTAEGK